jgi:hypothetical protein
VTVSALVRWADESVKRIGRPRTETILDVSEMMGYLTPELKQLLAKLIAVEPGASGSGVAGRDYLDSLIEITSLLGRDTTAEWALLSILPQETRHR